jgi:F0F1-type ATP synthase assembly protein I
VLAIDLPHARRLALRVVLGQAAVTAVAALLAWALAGRAGGWSALGGAAVAWVTTLYARRWAQVPGRTVGAALGRGMVAELIKVIATIALFAAAARVPHLVWPALLCGYAVALASTWLSYAVSGGGQPVDWARDRVTTRG